MKQYYQLNGKKYFSKEEYEKARNAWMNYQSEQEQAFANYGFGSGMVILAGSQSEIVSFIKSKCD